MSAPAAVKCLQLVQFWFRDSAWIFWKNSEADGVEEAVVILGEDAVVEAAFVECMIQKPEQSRFSQARRRSH